MESGDPNPSRSWLGNRNSLARWRALRRVPIQCCLFVKGGRAPLSHFPPGQAGSEPEVRCQFFFRACRYAVFPEVHRGTGAPGSHRHRGRRPRNSPAPISVEGGRARERRPVLPLGAFRPAPRPERAAKRLLPTEKERGDGLERRPLVGTARRRRAKRTLLDSVERAIPNPRPLRRRGALPGSFGRPSGFAACAGWLLPSFPRGAPARPTGRDGAAA